MGWEAVAVNGVVGLALHAFPRLFYRSDGDAGRDAQMTRGLQAFGSAFLSLAALLAFLKLLGAA